MKSTILFIICSFSFAVCLAQRGSDSVNQAIKTFKTKKPRFILSGEITDAKTGEPLAGTSVSIQDARIGTIADNKGKYIIQNIPPGHHLVEISHTGYTSVVEHFDLISDIEKNFLLRPLL